MKWSMWFLGLTAGALVAGTGCGVSQVDIGEPDDVKSTAGQALTIAISRGTTSIGYGVGGPAMTEEQVQQLAELTDELEEKLEAHRREPTVSTVPTPQPTPLATSNPGVTSFDGLRAAIDAELNQGFTSEPPDHGLCAGNGYVVQAVNTSVAVYDGQSMEVLARSSANAFYHLPPLIDRTTGQVGALLSDPRCLYDAETHHFYVSWLEILFDDSFNFTGSKLHLAASQTDDPTATWNLYAWDVSGDGGEGFATPWCLGDFPQLGSDHNGIYVTTNGFCFDRVDPNAFNFEAQIYALSKAKLADGTLSQIARLHGLAPFNGSPPASLMPATLPPGERGQSARGGVEYLAASVDLYETTDGLANQVAIYALSNTSSLDSASPALSLGRVDLRTQPYAMPPPATQMDGPRPLGDLFGLPVPPLDTIDGRINQMTYAREKLWFGLNTAVQSGTEAPRSGIAYFVVEVEPSGRAGVKAELEAQGYIAPEGLNVMFPATVVTAEGRGLIGFSMAGPTAFPSVAYVTLDEHGVGPMHVAASGAAAEDGFSAFYGGVARWGDYSAGGVSEDGSIWFATEYIPDQPRDFFANWGSRIVHVDRSALGDR